MTFLILSCVVEESRLNAAYAVDQLLAPLGLRRIADGQEQGIDWIALTTLDHPPVSTSFDFFLDQVDAVLILNHAESEKSQVLKDLIQRVQRQEHGAHRWAVLVFLESPLLLPSAEAWILPGNGVPVNQWSDRAAARRDISDGVRFLLGQPRTEGPVSVFYSHSHKDEELRAELEKALCVT